MNKIKVDTMDTTLLVAINAKFIHSNLALRYINTYYRLKEGEDSLLMLEYSINQETDYILHEIISKQPKIIAFSCYLWNMEIVRKLSRSLKKILPDLVVIYGGPEVSYDAEDELNHNQSVNYIIRGEGEETFRRLHRYIIGKDEMPDTGVSYRRNNEVFHKAPAAAMNMDEIPFPYSEGLEGLEHRILYYETSRGCPFQCQYCLSSVEKGVRFKSLELCFKDLDFFIKKRVVQVKFVDRTFNAKREHALGIMDYIIQQDNGVTNFHFEVAPELIDEAFIQVLKKARKGLFQLEIGVQSTHKETLEIIKRKNHLPRIEEAISQVKALNNTHIHLDLIAGLPKEDYVTFQSSFNYVYQLFPDQLQLGFLKVLKGSGMIRMKDKHEIRYRDYPPYEVLSTDAIGYMELEKLKMVEEMVELFYNSGQFQLSMERFIHKFPSPFAAYEYLAAVWEERGMHHIKHQKLDLYQFLHEMDSNLDIWLTYDYCLNEKPRKKADWMQINFIESGIQRCLLTCLEENELWTKESGTYTTKQLSRMYHMDRINSCERPEYFDTCQRVYGTNPDGKGEYMVINYNRRDFRHHNGEVVLVTIE